MSYITAVFWQIEVTVPKDRALEVEDFFLRSGAQSTYELLYAEGRASNLVEDNTNLFFFFEEKFPARAFVPMALATLELAEAPFSVSQVKYADYLKEFEKSFKAFALTAKTALVPPWDKNSAAVEGLLPLYLVPGMAFGTGKHATTQLMVEFLEENVRATDTVIDMGCGSGILAIAALLYGAREAIGFDVETLAVESSEANFKLNRRLLARTADSEAEQGKKFSARFAVGDFLSLGDLDRDAAHTLFIANILPNIFEANAVPLKAALTACRAWALSGIPVAQGEAFSTFLRAQGFVNFATREKEEWLIIFGSN